MPLIKHVIKLKNICHFHICFYLQLAENGTENDRKRTRINEIKDTYDKRVWARTKK